MNAKDAGRTIIFTNLSKNSNSFSGLLTFQMDFMKTNAFVGS